MKTFLRRAILGPLVIPMGWTFIWCLAWLFTDAEAATKDAKRLTRDIWYGLAKGR